ETAQNAAEGVPDSVAAWEERYSESEDAVWSGNPNEALVATVAEMTPCRVLDVGCGEGADAIWLAEHGWDVTGVDLSTTVIDRARTAAEACGVDPEFAVGDGSTWEPATASRSAEARGDCDPVTAFSPHPRLPDTREELLSRVAAQVAPGGSLLLVSHATMPPWAAAHDEKFD